MARYRFLFGLAVLSISLFVVSIETEAKVLSNRNSWEINRLSKHRDGLLDTRVSSKRKLKTLGHLAPKVKACVPTQDEWGGFGGCFTGCLRSWGVDYKSGTACGAICVAAATGNVVAVAGCAGCLGTAEWIVGGCAMKCVWSSSFMPDDGPVTKGPRHPRRLRTTDQARLRVSSVVSGS